MERYEDEIELIVYARLVEALSRFQFRLSPEDVWKTALLKRRFDIVIYKGTNPFAVVEIKGSIRNKNLLARGTDQVRSAISITNSRFGIVTDSKQYFLYDRNNSERDFVQVSFDDLINRLVNPEEIRIFKKDKEKIQNIIIEAATKNLLENQELLSFIRSKSFLNKIDFDQNGSSYFFSETNGGLSSFENLFFLKLFGEFKPDQICRYTSLRTIFEMLNNVSFRMNGLVGMNDRSEVNYVETYLNSDGGEAIIEKPLIKENPNTISSINSRYITSCTTINRQDDLTLWRLYSDDAKGVCLIFDVKKSNLNKHVLIQRVKYADASGNHKELDFLKDIKNAVEGLTGFKFEFRKLGYWKHFFKPYDYSVEEEVRLLIIDNSLLTKLKTDWVMTYTHSIINPVIDFRLNSRTFPIQLKEILLGPKCSEQEINFVQLEEMIRRKRREIREKSLGSSLRGLKIQLSEIKHYR